MSLTPFNLFAERCTYFYRENPYIAVGYLRRDIIIWKRVLSIKIKTLETAVKTVDKSLFSVVFIDCESASRLAGAAIRRATVDCSSRPSSFLS